MPSSVSPTRFTSARTEQGEVAKTQITESHQTVTLLGLFPHIINLCYILREEGTNHDCELQRLTIDWRFAGQDDHNQLQTHVRHFQVFEHRLHAVGSLGVFTEARLPLNGHPGVLGDLSQLVSEAPNENHHKSAANVSETITRKGGRVQQLCGTERTHRVSNRGQ